MRLWKYNWSKEELEKMEKGEINNETKNVINSEVSHLKSVFIFVYIFYLKCYNKDGKFKEKLKKKKLEFQNT